MPKNAAVPAPRDIIIDILVDAESGWGPDEELRRDMEENVFIMSLVSQMVATLTHFGWLRTLPKAS